MSVSGPLDSSLTVSSSVPTQSGIFRLLTSLLLAALAGGMSWGIRGQYGHETGAMIFGVLVGFVIVLFYLPQASSLQAARAIGLLTLAIGFGGSMTYGQTIGLTLDPVIHGNLADPHWNVSAYRWGLIGLGIKGALWIGFGGLFLGIGLGGKRYRPWEMFCVGVALVGLFFLGRWVLNMPHDPENHRLPFFYFSEHWHWKPEGNLKPRREVWGGMLFALAGMLSYIGVVKRDRLAVNLCLWGLIGGLGFPFGQYFQAAAAWNPAAFKNSLWQVGVNPWNTMEVTFGMVAGVCLTLGCWRNRSYISQDGEADQVTLSLMAEGWLIGAYVYVLLIGWYFDKSIFITVHQFGILMGVLPMTVIVGSRYAPFLYVLPIVAVSILVKTFLERFKPADPGDPTIGLVLLITIPLAFLIWVALAFGRRSEAGERARSFASIGLPLTATLYFWLNFTFFAFPWKWFTDWRGLIAQNQSGGIYIIAWLTLTLAGLIAYLRPAITTKS